MKHKVPHELEPEKARELLQRLLDTYVEHYEDNDVKAGWKDDGKAEVDFNVSGKKLCGTIEVCEGSYDIDLELPWMFRPFKKRIAKSVDDEFARWLGSAYGQSMTEDGDSKA